MWRSGLWILALCAALLGVPSVAGAADGTLYCTTYTQPMTFSYTPAHQSYPNSHTHDQIGGSGYKTFTKWEGGNLQTSVAWKSDAYTLAGTQKEAWCYRL